MDSKRDRRTQSNEARTGDLKLGAVRRMYKTFGMANAFWRRQSASCALSCFSRLPSVSSCSTLVSQTVFNKMSPPMGEPRRVALAGSTARREGESESMLDLDDSSTQIISDLSWFNYIIYIIYI